MKWISVKDELPAPGVEVLVTQDGNVYASSISGTIKDRGIKGRALFFSEFVASGHVSHWMPFPTPARFLG